MGECHSLFCLFIAGPHREVIAGIILNVDTNPTNPLKTLRVTFVP